MRRALAGVVLATLMMAPTALAACPYPKQLSDLPNGKTATKEEMLEAQGHIRDYVAAMEAYLQCLEDEMTAMGDSATEEHSVIHTKRHNAAIDAMDLVTGQFNEAVRQFKARD